MTGTRWNSDDGVEDGCKDTKIPKKNQFPLEEGYESDYLSPSKPSSSRMPLQSRFLGNILHKTKENINGNLFCKTLNQKNVKASKTTVEFSNGQIIRKSDVAFPKSNLSNIRTICSFRRKISFLLFPDSDFEVGSKRTKKAKRATTRKIGPKTRLQTELAASDNDTNTSVSKPSAKPVRKRYSCVRIKKQIKHSFFSLR